MNIISSVLRQCLLFAICSGFLISHSASAQETQGSISGRVVEASVGQGLEGAIISIEELGREAASDGSGKYRLTRIPPGRYTLTTSYLGADPKSESVQVDAGKSAEVNFVLGDSAEEALLVVGQRAGQFAALNQERASDNFKTIVAADAIGNFPDQNVTEALQRLPGLSITRDQGEGRFPVVRGTDPNFNVVLINGARVPSPEADERSVPLDVIPSDLLSALEVTKALTPDMDADSLGGTIEVKSLTAFDRGGFSAKLRAEASYNEKAEETSPKVTADWTNLFSLGDGEDNLGVALSLSHFDRDFASDNIEQDGIPEDGFAPELEQRDYVINRERQGLTASIDFRPDDSGDEYYLRYLLSDFADTETRRRNEFKFEDGDGVGTLTPSVGNFTGIEIDRDYRTRTTDQQISSLVIGGLNYAGPWTVDYKAAFSKAEDDIRNRLEAEFRQEDGVIDAGYEVGRDFFNLVNTSSNFFDTDLFALNELVLRQEQFEDTENAIQIDIEREVNYGNKLGTIKFGAKTREREKEADLSYEVFAEDLEGLGVNMTDFVSGMVDDYEFGTFGPSLADSLVREFIFSNLDILRTNHLDTEASNEDSNIGDFKSSEDITAAYIMGSVDLSESLRLIAGLRYEDTNFETQGKDVDIANETAEWLPKESNSYTNILPSLHVRFEPNNTIVMRASWTNSVARPLFDQSAARIIEDDEDLYIGNPDLDPVTSSNLDFSVAWYPESSSTVVGVGLFYKDIDDFIVEADILGIDTRYPNGTLNRSGDPIEGVFTSINGGGATLLGLELNFQTSLDHLSAPWDGFLINANATFVDSEAELESSARDGDLTVQLPRQSDFVGNLSIGYEKGPWSIRSSVAYRDSYLDAIGSEEAEDVYVREHTQFDVTLKYDISDRLTLYGEWVNANDEPFSAVSGRSNGNTLVQYETYGYTIQAGVIVTF